MKRSVRIDQKGAAGAAVTAVTPRSAVWMGALLCAVAAWAEAGVTGATLPVRGMTCALCTKSVEESVKNLGGVKVAADLAAGLVRVEATDGRSITLNDVRERILLAGFKLGGEVDLEAIGRFTIGTEGRITFRITGGAAYQILENDMLRRMFRRHAGLAGEFKIAFRLHDHPEWKPPAISVTGFEAWRSPTTAAG